MCRKVAIVTGANKGIGLEIVRGLCKEFNGDVYLTARSEDLGLKAVELLKSEGLNPKFHQLDITDKASIEKLRQFIKDEYNGLDVLVNNAGICQIFMPWVKYPDDCEKTMETNYYGTLDVCNALIPLLRSRARVVNVSSSASTDFLARCSESRRSQIISSTTVDQVTSQIEDFTKHSLAGTYISEGWSTDLRHKSYGMSKTGITVFTSIHQSMVDADETRSDIVINACCPGFCDTDMTAHNGPLKPSQGADTPLFLALLPLGTKQPRGQFVFKRKVYDWKNNEGPDHNEVVSGFDYSTM